MGLDILSGNVLNSTSDVVKSFNVSVKFGNLLHYPSRLLSRVRTGLDDLLYQEDQATLAFAAANAGNRTGPRSRYDSVVIPGPWGFLTSSYVLGLFAVALILNRIQNIVVPPRRPLMYHVPQTYRNPGSVFRLFYRSLFPVNLSSTFCRLTLRIPSLYFLFKTLALWTVILLQAFDIFPSWQWDSLRAIGEWAARKEMEDVCWFTFVSICGGLCVGALTRGLEGQGAANSSPFNLFGYAFLLHIYSSPVTHVKKVPGMPSRPDPHVIITIILPLLQVTMIHALGIKQRWSRQRLVPTAICSVLTLLHFHSVLWFSDSPYPLLNHLPCVLETTLGLITLLTITLNALTQLLLEGAITRPLFGHSAALLPKWDEDFSVALLRLGTASLEATSMAGLGNEVGGVNAADSTVALGRRAVPHTEYGVVEMNRFGVTSVSHTIEGRGRRRKRKVGFANEIKSVKTVVGGQEDLWWDALWFKELTKFGIGIGRVCKGIWRLVWSTIRRKPRALRELATEREGSVAGRLESVEPDGGSMDGEEDVDGDTYERFLQNENVSDDEGEYQPPARSWTDSSGSDSDGSEAQDREETVNLYEDLSSTADSGASATAPLLLAHMTNSSSSPLTRRRYTRLVLGSRSTSTPDRERDDIDELEGIMRERAVAARAQRGQNNYDGLEESRRNCVICTVEPRQIICWPCRCLALCDDCRENLASRSAASKHTCPCCRSPIEGYSKIYVP